MTQLGVAGKGGSGRNKCLSSSRVKRGTLYGKVIDDVPVADLLQNGLKMAAICDTSHDAFRHIKRSLAKLLSSHRLGNWN